MLSVLPGLSGAAAVMPPAYTAGGLPPASPGRSQVAGLSAVGPRPVQHGGRVPPVQPDRLAVNRPLRERGRRRRDLWLGMGGRVG